MEQEKRKNFLYLSYGGHFTNFYSSIEKSTIYNFILKSDLKNLSLESYDGFIVDLFIFKYVNINVEELLQRIYSNNKPVILVYSHDMSREFSAIKYLEDNFEIKFENKDAAIIENSYNEYLPERFNDYAMSMLSKKGDGKSYIKNTKNCFILNFGNITVLQDCEIEFTGKNNIKQKPQLLIDLIKAQNCEETPAWVNELKILDELKIEENLTKIELEIQRLEDEKKEYSIKLDENKRYKELLFTSGKRLVEIVKKLLMEMLNVPIQDFDVEKEDLSFELNNKKVLVEVKGINTGVKRENVSQIQRHIEDDAKINGIDDDEFSNKYKGLLIINPYIKTSVKERKEKEIYSKTVIDDLEHYGICAIDTITLLGKFQRFKAGEIIDLKDVILNNNCIQPDFSILQGNNEK